MKKRFLASLIAVLMVMSLIPMTVFADYGIPDPLFVQNCDLGFHHNDIGSTSGGQSVTKDIKPNGYQKKAGEYFVQTDDPAIWLLLYPGVDKNGAPVYDGEGRRVFVYPYSIEDDIFPEYEYICPVCGRSDWATYSNMSATTGGTNFDGKNIQVVHYSAYDFGSLKVTADVEKEHDVVDYGKEWAQDYAEEWAQDYAKEWAQDYGEEWAQDFAIKWAQDFAKVFIPTFEKRMSSASGTLVSGITYGYGEDGKGSLQGNYLKNGMTYLEIDTQNAPTRDNPLKVFIADSSPNSNGKKGPTEYNKNFEYFYNLFIEDGKLNITFDDRYISAAFGVLVQKNPFTGNPTSSIKHDNNGIKELPSGASKVYVFFHATSVNWYPTGEYEFVKWEFKENFDVGDKYKTGTFPVGSEYPTGNTIPVGDKRLTGNKFDVGDKYLTGNTFDVGDKYPTGNTFPIESSRRTVKDNYDVDFDLVITNASSTKVYDGKIANGGEVVIPNLTPGIYTAVLSSIDFTDKTKTISVVAGAQAVINFNDITTVKGTDQVGDYDSSQDETVPGDYKSSQDVTVTGDYDSSQDTTVPGNHIPAEDKTVAGVYIPSEDVTVTGNHIVGDDVYLGSLDPDNPANEGVAKYTPAKVWL